MPWSPSPVEIVRDAKLTRFEVWSPKRAERLTLFSHEALALWVMIEATPSIANFCLPGSTPIGPRSHMR